ncbi:4-coumarate--CoA ligase 1-like [Aricia agestis]|uniref:4-coumarate--CoA ligase 1-like n=1 Tax=Aricia agestis TaxID=91739 RepID=UPI001C2029B8|nr:4-coumarate--CoA ligase 1-like [Aricia agestis]XP_041981239.1 4-coumarate--CoA ligase 1-like [Aricia agestis]
MSRRILRQFNGIRRLSSSTNIIKSPLRNITVPNSRFLDHLWRKGAGFRDHIAIECAETKKNYTYKQLQKCSAIFATSLRKKLGLKENDVVAVLLPNGPEFPVVMCGTLQAGCILTSINPLYKEFEICHQASNTEPKVVVTIPECYETLRKGLEAAKSNAKVVLVTNKEIPEDTIRYTEIAETGEADFALLDKVEKKNDDIALIPFSSGTTGLPKGVSITHGNLLAALEIMDVDETRYPMLTNGSFQDVIPCILPFYHIYGMVITMFGHFVSGCKLVTLPKFTTGLYLDVLKNYQPAILYIVPPIAIFLGKHPDVKTEHFAKVRHVVCGAAPLAASDAVAVLEKGNANMEINQGYGATETTSLFTSTIKNTRHIDYAACGVLMSNMELKIVDPISGKDLPADQTGEICIRSPTVMKSYYKNEQATKECMTEDGFFRTGDLGNYNPNSGLFVSDRIKELIKVKGLQVAPAELEGVLRTHPAVQEAAVIGVPHTFYGETPVAYVIKKSGLDTTPVELQSFVAEKVAPYKKLEEVVFVNDIPKTPSGKILRRELKKKYA